MTLRLGVPSKGRLMDRTFQWFADRGVAMQTTGTGREYAASSAMEGLEIRLLSAGEMPRDLEKGLIHLGVTGMDVVQDRLASWKDCVDEIARLGFGQADLVVAVPDFWVDVADMHDLDAVAASFRTTHGRRLRIATKYHRLVREFFREKGVADYQLVDSQGATEGTVRHLTAEAIADITTSGETLRANHLRPLDDGVILRSQAALFRSRQALWTDETQGLYARLRGRLDLEGAQAS